MTDSPRDREPGNDPGSTIPATFLLRNGERLGPYVLRERIREGGHGRGLAGRPGRTDSQVQSRLVTVMGQAYTGLGLSQEAQPLYEQALVLSENASRMPDRS